VPVGGARARVRKRQATQGQAATTQGQEPTARTPPRTSRGGQTTSRRHRGGQGSGSARTAGQGSGSAGAAGQGSGSGGAAGQGGGSGGAIGQSGQVRAAGRGQQDAATARPWYELAGGWHRTDGSKHCGSLERLVHRQWDDSQPAPPEALHAVNRLAELPQKIKDLLSAGVDAIYVGPGGVPELDDMGRLRGVALPSGRATWDACAGAYGDRKIVVGTRPSPSPDVMCHEVGHAIDDADAPPGRWQSDSAEFRMLYDQCLPHLVSDFHRQQGALGRREFFADAFAAIASRQRPALVDMLGGSTRVALNVMLFFNKRYGV
jgi:hypothetical protein